MSKNLKSLDLILKISHIYNINEAEIIKKYNIYYDFIKHSKKLKIRNYFFIEKILYILYLLYLISPIHLITLHLYYFYINKLNDKKIIFSVNKDLMDRWKKFSEYPLVHTIILDNLFGKIFCKRLSFKKIIYVITNYVKLLLIYLLNNKKRAPISYDIELFQKFLNDYMIGNFIGGFNSNLSLDGVAYTLNLAKYVGIKEINEKIEVSALQVHAASNEPMMIFFQADKIFSINVQTSLYFPQIIGLRKEEVVGSRLLNRYINDFSGPLEFNPQGRSILVLFGNTHHPKGIYYGPNHNELYKKFLEDLKNLSIDFSFWEFYYLNHKNFKSNFEIDYLSDSSFIQLDPSSNVYSTSLNNYLVISFGSTVVTELYDFHPNIYMYSPSSSSPYRVKDEKFRFIKSYENLKKLMLGFPKNTNNFVNNKFLKKNLNNSIDFDQELYKACLK